MTALKEINVIENRIFESRWTMKYLVISIKGSAAYIVGNKTVYFLKEYSLRSEAYNTVE
jgi:hypothetical protein